MNSEHVVSRKTVVKGVLAIVAAVVAILYSSHRAHGEGLSLYGDGLGVYKIPRGHDKGEFGAGLEVGLNLNKHVSLGIQNVSYKTPDDFGGLLVDESSAVVHATLFSSENNKLHLGVDASGVRDWNGDDWGFGVGPRLSYNFTKNIQLGAGAQIRAFIKGRSDLYFPVSLGYSF